MLSDRSYMRDDYPRQGTSALTWLISGIVAMFVLQFVFLRWFHFELENLLALSVPNILSGKVWVVLSYGLLHSTGNLLHIIVNLLGLYFLGRVLEPIMGSKRFVGFFRVGRAGGRAFVARHALAERPWRGDRCLGGRNRFAGGVRVFEPEPADDVSAVLHSARHAEAQIRRARAARDRADRLRVLRNHGRGLAVQRLGGALGAPRRHGGRLAVFSLRALRRVALPTSRSDVELPGWLQKRQKKTTPETPYQVDVPKREDLRAEVDRILDKINSHGFGSLTPEEKRLLDEARDLLSRR
ncbi:MAG: rhomboid family intramembrane serine protease [Opitutus sp.]|nr:rhomboid family intramembrane serine protease [Opitutus sp.]